MAVKGGKIQGAGILWRIPLLAGIMASLAYFLPGLSTALQYDRNGIEKGQLWRFLTAHWTHWSAGHLIWDTVMFLVLLAWTLRISPKQAGLTLGISSIGIPWAIYLFQPELACYRGLSGLDAALFAYGAMHLLKSVRRDGDRLELFLVISLMAGLGIKILFEAVTGNALFVTDMAHNVIVVPLAHILGAGVGCIIGAEPSLRIMYAAGFPNSR